MLPAKLGNGNFIYVFSSPNGGSASNSGIWNGYNYFGISIATDITRYSPSSSMLLSSVGMSVQQASAIDKKMDDGLPQSGNVLAFYLAQPNGWIGWAAGGGVAGTAPWSAASPSSTTCYDNGGNASNTMAYSITTNNGTGMNCALSFKFQ